MRLLSLLPALLAAGCSSGPRPDASRPPPREMLIDWDFVPQEPQRLSREQRAALDAIRAEARKLPEITEEDISSNGRSIVTHSRPESFFNGPAAGPLLIWPDWQKPEMVTVPDCRDADFVSDHHLDVTLGHWDTQTRWLIDARVPSERTPVPLGAGALVAHDRRWAAWIDGQIAIGEMGSRADPLLVPAPQPPEFAHSSLHWFRGGTVLCANAWTGDRPGEGEFCAFAASEAGGWHFGPPLDAWVRARIDDEHALVEDMKPGGRLLVARVTPKGTFEITGPSGAWEEAQYVLLSPSRAWALCHEDELLSIFTLAPARVLRTGTWRAETPRPVIHRGEPYIGWLAW